jgi:hypothetical protein
MRNQKEQATNNKIKEFGFRLSISNCGFNYSNKG